MSIATGPEDFSSAVGAIRASRGGTGGYIARIVPKSWEYRAFPELSKRNEIDLANLLTTPSAKTRLHAQQEILRRGGSGKEVLAIVLDKRIAPRARIAALYTLKQLLGKKSHQTSLALMGDPDMAEHALRALPTARQSFPVFLWSPSFKLSKIPIPGFKWLLPWPLVDWEKRRRPKHCLPSPILPLSIRYQERSLKKKEMGEGGNLHQSPIIEGKRVHLFDLDVSDWKELHPTLGDGGNGNGSDHGAWFDPVLIKSDCSSVCLTDSKWSKATQGWGKTGVGISATGAKLARNDGKPISTGIGTLHQLEQSLIKSFLEIGSASNAPLGLQAPIMEGRYAL